MKKQLFFALSMLISHMITFPLADANQSTESQEVKPHCAPCTPYATEDRAIAKSRLFYACIDHRDARVPRLFVQTHEHIGTLSEWTSEHWQEFGMFLKALEGALRKTFNAELINVACLMNLAGKEGTHTHWHFIVRLPQQITFVDPATGEEHIYQDPCFGKPYDMNGKNYRAATPAIRMATIQAIQNNLDVSSINGGELKKIGSVKEALRDKTTSTYPRTDHNGWAVEPLRFVRYSDLEKRQN